MAKIVKASVAGQYIYLCWRISRFVMSICKTGDTSYVYVQAKYFRYIILILFLWRGGGAGDVSTQM
jgi:hypothetical protein